jgi:hypothetical protein
MKQLLNQLLLVVKLKYSLRMLYCHHHGWVNRYGNHLNRETLH